MFILLDRLICAIKGHDLELFKMIDPETKEEIGSLYLCKRCGVSKDDNRSN